MITETCTGSVPESVIDSMVGEIPVVVVADPFCDLSTSNANIQPVGAEADAAAGNPGRATAQGFSAFDSIYTPVSCPP